MFEPSKDRVEILVALRRTALVAVVALVGVAPHLYYLTSVAFAERMRSRFTEAALEQLVRAEVASLGLVVLIAASVGTLFAGRYGLPGVGDTDGVRRAGRLVLVLAPALSLITYAAFGRAIAERVPGYYPSDFAWAAAKALKGALFDEVVARYGMMTILCGAFRRIWLANAIQACFFTLLAVLGLSFYSIEPTASVYFAASITASVAIHLLLGWIYSRYGLLAAMAFHLLYGVKYLLHAALS